MKDVLEYMQQLVQESFEYQATHDAMEEALGLADHSLVFRQMESMQDLLVMHVNEFHRKQQVISSIRYYPEELGEHAEKPSTSMASWSSSSCAGAISSSFGECLP